MAEKRLEDLRKEIDRIDNKILDHLVQRARVAKQIGDLKNLSGAEVYSSAREHEIVSRLVSKKIGPLREEDVEAIFQEIFSVCRNLQKKLRISFRIWACEEEVLSTWEISLVSHSPPNGSSLV